VSSWKEFEIINARKLLQYQAKERQKVPIRQKDHKTTDSRLRSSRPSLKRITATQLIMMSYPSTIRKPMILATSSAEASEPPAKKREF
jgi:uncharacterized FAD-dependent dehydrogenase